jgi:hypothetical protein
MGLWAGVTVTCSGLRAQLPAPGGKQLAREAALQSEIDQTSRFETVSAFVSMNSRRGST